MPLASRVTALATRVAQEFKRRPVVAGRSNGGDYPTLSAIGDSITATNSSLTDHQAGQLSWIDMGVAMSGSKWDFIGASATPSIGINYAYDNLLTPVINARPDYCLVLLGHNDYVGEVDAAERQKYIDLLTQLQHNRITPIIVTNLPVSADPIVHSFNNWLRQVAAREGFPLFDAFSAMVNSSTGVYRDGEHNGDGVHPSALGAKKLAQAFAAWTNQLLGSSAGQWTRLVTATHDNRVMGGNGLFTVTDGTGNWPSGWTGITDGTSSIAAAPHGFGNQLTLTKTSGTVRFQANGPAYNITAGQEYRLSFHMVADVEAFLGTWTFELYETASWTLMASIVGYSFDMDGTVSLRFKPPAGVTQLLFAFKVMGNGSHEESGAIGTNLKISRMTIEAVQSPTKLISLPYAPIANPVFTGTVSTPALRVSGGSPAAGKVLTATDTDGNSTWQVPSGGDIPYDIWIQTFPRGFQRSTGYAESIVGLPITRDIVITGFTHRFRTADSAAGLDIAIVQDGAAIPGTRFVIPTGDQTSAPGYTVTGLDLSVSAGSRLRVYVYATGGTPGFGLETLIMARLA